MKMTYPAQRAYRLSTLTTAGIIAAMILYSLLIGFAVADNRQSILLALMAIPVVILGCVFSVRYFVLLVLLLPFMAWSVPLDIPTGTASHVPISMAVCAVLTGIWVVSMCFRGWSVAPSPFNRPLLVLTAVMFLSLIWSTLWRDPLVVDRTGKFIVTQLGSLGSYVLSFTAALLIGNFVDTPRRLKYIVGTFIVCGALTAFGKLIGHPFFFLHGMGLWALWMNAPIYALVLTHPNLSRWLRLVLTGLLLMTLYLVILVQSHWLSGWTPSVVALFSITLLHSRRLFAIVVIVAALGYFTPPVQHFFQETQQAKLEEGDGNRLDIWQHALSVVQPHWFLGTGVAGYALYYMTYTPDEGLASHNNYVDIVAQFGIVGVCAWLWLAVTILYEGWRLIQRLPPGFLRSMAIAATGGWMGAQYAMVQGDWVLPFAYTQGIVGYKYTVFSWMFLGILICVRRMLEKQAAEAQAAETISVAPAEESPPPAVQPA